MQSEDGDKRENVFCCVKIHDIYGGGDIYHGLYCVKRCTLYWVCLLWISLCEGVLYCAGVSLSGEVCYIGVCLSWI